jgi:ATP-dependent Clp protease ATP-binding subunit ClpA
MDGLEPGLKARLKRLKVRVDKPDADTLVLRNVPADGHCFSKPQTSVLVKRPREGMPFLVCVDEDLEYCGPDPGLARAFAAAGRSQGWRVVTAAAGVYEQAGEAVEQTLDLLGNNGRSEAAAKPQQPSPAAPGLLARFAVNLTAELRAGHAPPAVGREEQAEQVATSVLAWQRRLPLVVGPPGVGKTNLIYKVAGQLNEVRPEWEVLSLDVTSLLAGALWEAEREKLFNAALEEAPRGQAVLVLERLELAVMTSPLAPWLLASALDRGVRLVGTCLPGFAEKLARGPLARRIDTIDLGELAREDTAKALAQLKDKIGEHHGVTIDAETVEATVARALSLAGNLPDKAIALLDAAAARAVLQKQLAVTLCDLYLAASRMKE